MDFIHDVQIILGEIQCQALKTTSIFHCFLNVYLLYIVFSFIFERVNKNTYNSNN